jgi:hypothetical protein
MREEISRTNIPFPAVSPQHHKDKIKKEEKSGNETHQAEDQLKLLLLANLSP